MDINQVGIRARRERPQRLLVVKTSAVCPKLAWMGSQCKTPCTDPVFGGRTRVALTQTFTVTGVCRRMDTGQMISLLNALLG